MEEFINIKEACQYLDVKERTLKRWILKYKLPCYKITTKYKFLKSELNDFILKKKLN